MKHIFLVAGIGVVAYAIWRNHQAGAPSNAPTSVGTSTGAFNGGVANTSGNGMTQAATNIGASDIAGASIMSPTVVMRDSPSALAFFGGGNAAHPLDF